MKLPVAAIVLSVCLLPTGAALAQDFNCKTARTATEGAICGNKRLRKLDEQMGVEYGYARRFQKSQAAEQDLIADQKAWLRKRDTCGAEIKCLKRAYRKRIDVLGDRASGKQSYSGGQTSSCSIAAYSTDRDRNGLNVRAAPGMSGKVIAKLKLFKDGPDHEILPEFTVVGANGDWLKITDAREGLDGRLLTRNEGWVHTSRVAMMTRGYGAGGVVVRHKRSKFSSKLGRIPPETEVRVLGCKGNWARVEHRGLRGWLAPADQCGTAATTCN